MTDINGNGWTGEERRMSPKEGWTLWKEVWGTFLGALPSLLIAGGAMMNLYSLVQVHTVEIEHLKEADSRHEQQLLEQRRSLNDARLEISSKLERIDTRLERLGELVAGQQGRQDGGNRR